MEAKKKRIFSTDKTSDSYLEINACGIEHINKTDRGSNRPEGRCDYQIIYVQKGVCNLFLDGEWQKVPAGGVVLFRPYEAQKYYYRREDNSVSHYVHFTGVGCEEILRRMGIYDVDVFAMGQSSAFERLSEQMVREFSMRRPVYMDTCVACLLQMLALLARKYALRQSNVNTKSESRINAACRRIYDNVKEPPSAEELAAECCLSVSRFLHLFKEVTEKPLKEFINDIRVKRAKEMLALTEMSVRDIACAVGFDDQNYFSRVFRKAEGCSPTEYRKNSD